MAFPVIQPSFAAGELSPSLYGRVDLAKFHVGAALLRNFFVDYRGGISNRTGTLFVGTCIDSTKPNRLIKFQFSTVQSYALLFGNLTMKVIINGGFVKDHVTGFDYVLTTPYLGSELALLKFTQSADVMTLCHANHAPQNLTRTANDAWTITPINFIPTLPGPAGVTATPSLLGGTTSYAYVVTAVASNGLTESLPSVGVGIGTNSQTMSSTPGASVVVSWTPVTGATLYNIYRLPEVPDGLASGTQLFGFVGTATAPPFVDCNIAPDFTQTPPLPANPFASSNNPTCCAYFQQRLVFGAPVNQPETFFMSKTGDFPNFGYSTPGRSDDSITGTIASQQVNAIKHLVPMNSLIAFSSGGAWRIDSGAQGGPVSPSAIEAAPQAFSGCSDVPPITVNYDILYVQEKGSIVRDLAYNFYVNVYTGQDMTTLSNHLFYGHKILEWAYAEEPFKIVWAVRDDGVLLSFTYLKEQDVYGWAHHDTLGLFKSVCSVSENGEDMVYVIVQRQLAAGFVQCVERLQSRDMDAVPEYGVPADLSLAWFVDCGLELPQHFPAATVTPSATDAQPSITSALVINGGQNYVNPIANLVDPTGVGAAITLQVSGGVVIGATVDYGGINYTNPQIVVRDAGGSGSGAILQAQTMRLVTLALTNVVPDIDQPDHIPIFSLNESVLRTNGGWGYVVAVNVVGGPPPVYSSLTLNIVQPFVNTFPADVGAWRATPPVTQVSGLDHLEGMTVSILADGAVIEPQVVTGGTIFFDEQVSSAVAGLPYVAQGTSLYADIPGESPTVQGRRKTINAATMRVQDTRGLLIGPSFDQLTGFKERGFEAMGDPVAPITGDLRVSIPGTYDTPGQLFWEQPDPLPATLLAMIPEIVVGDQ